MAKFQGETACIKDVFGFLGEEPSFMTGVIAPTVPVFVNYGSAIGEIAIPSSSRQEFLVMPITSNFAPHGTVGDFFVTGFRDNVDGACDCTLAIVDR